MDRLNRFADVLTIAVLVLAVIIGARALVGTAAGPPSARPQGSFSTRSDWQSFVDSSVAIGAPNASVTLVVFSDFECPFCALFDETIDSILARYPDDVRLIFRHAPAQTRRHAGLAARASECAMYQGKFREMTRALFRGREEFGSRSWSDFAASSGVGAVDQFESCMSNASSAQLERDMAAAQRLGIAGTPTALVNATLLVGNVPLPVLDSVVRAARGRDK